MSGEAGTMAVARDNDRLAEPARQRQGKALTPRPPHNDSEYFNVLRSTMTGEMDRNRANLGPLKTERLDLESASPRVRDLGSRQIQLSPIPHRYN
jgi:hypothetical protein